MAQDLSAELFLFLLSLRTYSKNEGNNKSCCLFAELSGGTCSEWTDLYLLAMRSERFLRPSKGTSQVPFKRLVTFQTRGIQVGQVYASRCCLDSRPHNSQTKIAVNRDACQKPENGSEDNCLSSHFLSWCPFCCTHLMGQRPP